MRLLITLSIIGVLLPSVNSAAGQVPDPETVFGHQLGASRELVSYDQAVPFLRTLAETSPVMDLVPIGVTYGGRDLLLAVISSPDNLALLEEHKRISRRLHNPAGMTQQEISAMAEDGKTVLMVGLNMHASEIISSQTGLEWIWRLVSSPPDHLEDVIVLVVPTLNPDGQVLICDWYRRTLNSTYEGCSMPWLYHAYAGHDINRDWFMLNLEETRAVNRVMREWQPQVVVDVHQMSQTGPRVFVPPYANPISTRVHPLVHRWSHVIGNHMALRLEQNQNRGVVQSYYFDAYWPGGLRSTPWWKNTVGILIESASCRLATPVHIDPGELTAGHKGLPDYQARANFPNPWGGGWWTPRNIVDQQITALDAALESCSKYRRDLLVDRAAMSRRAMSQEPDKPQAVWVPHNQHDPAAADKLVQILQENGVQVLQTAGELTHQGIQLPMNSVIIPFNQPLRSLIDELLRPHPYPQVRTSPDQRRIYEPYDVTAWTLPDLLGVEVRFLNTTPRPLTTFREGPWGGVTQTQEPETEATWVLPPSNSGNYSIVMTLLQQGSKVEQLIGQGPNQEPRGSFVVTGPLSLLQEAAGEQAFEAAAVSWGDHPVSTRSLRAPRLGIYQPWTPSMDEGWVRYVCDQFNVAYATLHNPDIQGGQLAAKYDVIVIPNMDVNSLIHGHRARDQQKKDPRPSPYDQGLTQAGADELRRFVNAGGTLVTLGAASEFPLREFDLPVIDISRQATEMRTPGVLLEVDVDNSHPLAYGMPSKTAVFHTDSPVFSTQPHPGQARAVVCRYPADRSLVRSGWGRGLDPMRLKAALVEMSMGDGSVVLFGFRPQFRGWTRSSYRFMFNAFLNAAAS